MRWDDLDTAELDQQPLREIPRVIRAPERGVYVADSLPAENEPDYLFDEPDTWNETLDVLAEYPKARQSRAASIADGDANPYARKRQSSVNIPDQGTEPVMPIAGGHGAGLFQSRGNPMLYAGVIIGCLFMLGLIAVMMMPQVAGYFWKDLDNFAFINGEVLRYDRKLVNNYKQYRDSLKRDVIFEGIFVDGVHVGGLSIADAQAKLTSEDTEKASSFSVTVSIGNKTWVIDNSVVPATRNVDSVLARAYNIGRSNTTAIIGTAMTPFRERVGTVLALRENYVYLKSEPSYDHAVVQERVNEIAAYVTRDPVDAQIQSFNANTRTFAFTDEQPGVTINRNALYTQLTAMLDRGAVGETLTVTPTITTPSITKTDMMNSFKLVSAFTTKTTSDKDRNNNISLACQAINGKVLMPGESFSFNESTGQRTTAKGYRSAGAIAAGQSIEEVGGGICQVSSTLFNAVARADLEIVSRSPHAWPSTYVKIGEDATVNWPNLDFKFTNNKATPVFIIAYYKDRKCSAEIWGMTLGTGVTIDLESKIVKTVEPSTQINYKQNPELPAGTSKETVKSRTGYVVETYKVWFQNGTETKRELLHTSTYKAYQTTIEYN